MVNFKRLIPSKFPKLRIFGGRRFIWLGVLIVLIVIVGAGAFSVYTRPDAAASQRFARTIPFPAALVGFRVIWVNEVLAQQRFTTNYSQKTNQVIPPNNEVRSQILDHLVELRLAGGEAQKHGIRVTSDDVNQSFDTLAQQNGGKEQILATLKELYGMDEATFKTLLADEILLDKFRTEVLSTVSVRHILIKDQAKANDIAKQVKEGGDFVALAKEHSEDTGSKDSGGSLGFIGRGETVKPFEDAAFGMETGQISDPVQSEFGYHIIKVEEKKGTINQSYADWLAEAKGKTRIVKLLTR